jgi:hypothetical protein
MLRRLQAFASNGAGLSAVAGPVNYFTLLPGDINGDGLVDVADYDIWAANVGDAAPAGYLTIGVTASSTLAAREWALHIEEYVVSQYASADPAVVASAKLNFTCAVYGFDPTNTANGIIGLADYNDLATALCFGAGDINRDTLVDVADYDQWARYVGMTNALWQYGDLNGDGLVDVADYDIWAANVVATYTYINPS